MKKIFIKKIDDKTSDKLICNYNYEKEILTLTFLAIFNRNDGEIIKKVYQRVKYPYSVDFEKNWGDYMVKIYTNDYQLINK